jgi:hypothetical protein
MAKKQKVISKEQFLSNLDIIHIQRFQNKILDRAHPNYSYQDKDMIETIIKYKGANVITVYTQITPNYYHVGNTYTLTSKDIKIDVSTNRTFIKKHKLPFKKTKVRGDKKDSYDKEFIFQNEIQLQLGVGFVRKVLKEILVELKDKFDYIPEAIVTSRCNGIFMNSGTVQEATHWGNNYRECKINLK